MSVTDTPTTRTTAQPWVPDRATALTPYLAVAGAQDAISWYRDVLGAVPEREPIVMDDGRIGHAELRFSGALLMLADEFPEMGVVAPDPGASAVGLHLSVPDCDATIALAEERGATVQRPPADTPYGHRGGVIVDPWGHRWSVNTDLRALQGAPDPADETVDLGARAAATAEVAAAGDHEHEDVPVGKQGDVAHWTLSLPDPDRGRAFYGHVLGWVFEGGSVPGAWGVTDAVPGGGIWGPSDEGGVYPHGVSHCYQIDDMAAAIARVRDAGGTAGESEVRPYGTLTECVDDQGTYFQLWEPPAGAR